MNGARPVLGIVCCARSIGAEIAQTEIAQVVIHRYLEAAMRHANCAALLVPTRPDLMAAAEVADRLDGLLLTGSPSNLTPARFGRSEDPGEGPFDEGRDAMSMALIEAMIARTRPVFGICRGYQELNVAFGGTLQRGLADSERALAHHAPDGVPLGDMFAHVHDVHLTPDGVLARSFERTALQVNSVHFQGVETLGPGLSVEASAPDGLIEAFSGELEGAPVLGVQWHPEWQTERDAASLGFFGLLGRALRGDFAAWRKGD